jgi:hypothetical protein
LEPEVVVTVEGVVDNTPVVRIEIKEASLELLAKAITTSFEEYLRARGCRRATYVNEEPRYIEVVETLNQLHTIPYTEAKFYQPLERVDNIMWIPKHVAEMYNAVVEYVTEDRITLLLARITIVVDYKAGMCWQHIDIRPNAIELIAKEILRLLEQ